MATMVFSLLVLQIPSNQFHTYNSPSRQSSALIVSSLPSLVLWARYTGEVAGPEHLPQAANEMFHISPHDLPPDLSLIIHPLKTTSRTSHTNARKNIHLFPSTLLVEPIQPSLPHLGTVLNSLCVNPYEDAPPNTWNNNKFTQKENMRVSKVV